METQNTENNQSNSVAITVMALVIVVLFGYIGYLYSVNDMLKKGELQEQYIKKENLSFADLEYEESQKYILRDEHDTEIEKLNERITQLNSADQFRESLAKPTVIEQPTFMEKSVKVEQIVEVEKKVEVEKVVEVEKIVEVIKEIPPINRTKYQTYTCKSMKNSGVYIPKECKKELKRFILKNKDAREFEIIGMVDNKEFKLIKTLEDVYGHNAIKNISKFTKVGLSRKRVVEATWQVKKYAPKNANVNAVNYTITQKDKRGFVVRAYK